MIIQAMASMPKTFELEIWDQYSFDELFKKAGRLPKHSAIFYTPVFRDRTGAIEVPRSVAEQLGKAANAPIFGHHDTFLGTGVLGGYLISSRRHGELIARIALGEPISESIDELNSRVRGYVFDDAQLKRWNIAESRLPSPYTLTNRPEPIWQRYFWQIGVTLAAIVLEGLLILHLLFVTRQRSEAILGLAKEREGLERRVAERTEQLTEALDFNQCMLTNSPVPIGVYVETGECIFANVAYASFLGTTVEELLSQNLYQMPIWNETCLLGDCMTALKVQMPQQREEHVVAASGKDVWFEYRILLRYMRDKFHLLIQLSDFTELKHKELELRHLAFHDALTGLPNRRLLLDRLKQALYRSKRENSYMAAVYIDLDKFKHLKDIHGHDAGDQMLIEVAKRLRNGVRQSDTVARLGGDEFFVMLSDLGTDGAHASQYAESIVNKISYALNTEYVLGNIHYHGSASVGAKLFVGGDTNPGQVFDEADSAMYEIKRGSMR
jgi:diguanylate cyclase (GGDEF)-like protein/PAS domain S-box-containing protein